MVRVRTDQQHELQKYEKEINTIDHSGAHVQVWRGHRTPATWEFPDNRLTQTGHQAAPEQRAKRQFQVLNECDLEGPPRQMQYINSYRAAGGITIPDEPFIGCECGSLWSSAPS